jgi:hypothetical protein
MQGGYWTSRYNESRVTRDPVHLHPPLVGAWTYRPRGVGLGFVRAGHGDVLTTVGGRCRVSRVNLRSGRAVWVSKDETGVSLLADWNSTLLIFGDSEEARELDVTSGRLVRTRKCPSGLGLQDSFVVGNVLVGNVGAEFHGIDLTDLRVLWAVPKFAGTLVSDGNVVIWPDRDVVAFDLLTGKERWRRREVELGGRSSSLGCAWNGVFVVVIGGHLTAFDIGSGGIVWRWKVPYFVHWWHPYKNGRAYLLFDGPEPQRCGVYGIIDLRTGELLLERELGPAVPEPVCLRKKGFTAGTKGVPAEHWRDVRVVVSETHAFLQNASGQIVALKRDTGEVEEVVEIDGMPTGAEPVIYENRLLLTDFSAAVHCFEGA